MIFPYDIPLKDLLTFFLFVDLVVMVVVGAYTFKTRHKRGKTEKLLEEIRDLLNQNPRECAENTANKSTKQTAKLTVKASQKEKIEAQPSTVDPKKIYYEVEESTEASKDGLSELDLVKNALKDTPVIKPLLKMPKHIDDLVKRSRGSENAPKQIEAAKDADQSTPPPPPPPPTPAQIESTKNNDQKESG
jgi:hypothetical protein